MSVCAPCCKITPLVPWSTATAQGERHIVDLLSDLRGPGISSGESDYYLCSSVVLRARQLCIAVLHVSWLMSRVQCRSKRNSTPPYILSSTRILLRLMRHDLLFSWLVFAFPTFARHSEHRMLHGLHHRGSPYVTNGHVAMEGGHIDLPGHLNEV